MCATTKNQRATGALSLVRARYIIETEEWKVQPVADNASNDIILANGFSAVKTGDMATAEKMEQMLAAKVKAAPGGTAASANPHAEHGAAPAPAPAAAANPDAGKNVRIMHKEL